MTNKVKGTCVPVEYLVLGMLENNVYIISDGKATIVVDPSCKADEGFRSARDRSASRPRVLRAQGKANKWRDRAPRKPQRRPVPIAGRPPEPYTYICCPVVVTTRRPFFTPFVPRMRFAMSCTRPVSPRSTMTSRQWCASRCTCMDEMMDSK